jgi:hypothetical protein
MRAGIKDLECCRGWGYYTPTSVVTSAAGTRHPLPAETGTTNAHGTAFRRFIRQPSHWPCSACYITLPSFDCLPEAAILFFKRYARLLSLLLKPVPSPRQGSRCPRYRGAPLQNERTPRAGHVRGRPLAGPPSGGSCLEDLIASSPHS